MYEYFKIQTNKFPIGFDIYIFFGYLDRRWFERICNLLYAFLKTGR